MDGRILLDLVFLFYENSIQHVMCKQMNIFYSLFYGISIYNSEFCRKVFLSKFDHMHNCGLDRVFAKIYNYYENNNILVIILLPNSHHTYMDDITFYKCVHNLSIFYYIFYHSYNDLQFPLPLFHNSRNNGLCVLIHLMEYHGTNCIHRLDYPAYFFIMLFARFELYTYRAFLCFINI
jgi:hypothetical protein